MRRARRTVTWLLILAVLGADLYMTKVYLRQLRYPAYLPARSRPWRKD